MQNIECLRCKTAMHFIKTEKLQLGQTGWILGDLSNLISGALEVSIYACPGCGKIEFYQAEPIKAEDAIAKVTCPKCGKRHDVDYPKCPFCKHTY